MERIGRESYAAATKQLEAYARRAKAESVLTVGGELLAAARVLAGEPRLRRALADPARSGPDRAGLLKGLVTGKIGERTVELLATLVAGRWSTSGQLLDAVERLGVEALLASAERAGTLAEVEDELFRFGQIVDGDPALAAAVADSSVAADRRIGLVRGLLERKAQPVTLRLAELAVHGYGGRGVVASLTRLVELAAERRGRFVAYVTVAAPIADAEEQRLGTVLSRLYGRDIAVKTTVDPAVLGGMSVRVGDYLYDGTVLRRLNETRNALAGRK